jgi:AcrR family transcriptional regulator
VAAVLRQAAARGELSKTDIEWTIDRLAGRARRGNPRLQGVDRLDDILKAATLVFARRGYQRATIEEVANELMLTKAGVYHYFSSKQQILEAITERAMALAEEAVAKGIGEGKTPTQRLRLALEKYGTVVINEKGLSIFMRHFDELSESGQRELNARRKAIEATLRKVFEEGVKSKEFERRDSHLAVFGMFGAINWVYSWYEPGGRLPIDVIVHELVDQIIGGVGRR